MALARQCVHMTLLVRYPNRASSHRRCAVYAAVHHLEVLNPPRRVLIQSLSDDTAAADDDLLENEVPHDGGTSFGTTPAPDFIRDIGRPIGEPATRRACRPCKKAGPVRAAQPAPDGQSWSPVLGGRLVRRLEQRGARPAPRAYRRHPRAPADAVHRRQLAVRYSPAGHTLLLVEQPAQAARGDSGVRPEGARDQRGTRLRGQKPSGSRRA